jgi:hypothetical protein
VPGDASTLATRRPCHERRRFPHAFGAGALLVSMGVPMITGELSAFSYRLLETFPAFVRI